VIPAEEIRNAVADYIAGLSSPESIEYTAEVPRLFDVTVEGEDMPVIGVSHDPDKDIGRILPVTVTFISAEGETLKQLMVSTKLRKVGIAVVLKRDISRGDIIAESDVELIKTDITAERGVYTSLEDVNGMEAKKRLRTGAVLSETDIRAPYAVERGDKVTVEIRKRGILLRTDGTARESGSVGEKIKIYVDMTKATISCRIVDSATVVAGVEGGYGEKI
jgi:flagella basal body P-ring formation protein FlgA